LIEELTICGGADPSLPTASGQANQMKTIGRIQCNDGSAQ